MWLMVKKEDWVTGISDYETCYKVHSVKDNFLWIILNGKKYTETNWHIEESDKYIFKVEDFNKYKKIF